MHASVMLYFSSYLKMLFYETLQEIWTVENHKKYLKAIIKINNCDSQSV